MKLLEKDSVEIPFTGVRKTTRNRFSNKWLLTGIIGLSLYLVTKGYNCTTTTEEEIDFTKTYLKALDTNLASNWSKIYTSGPHLAGKGAYLAEFTRGKFEEYGADVELDEYEVLVSYPKDHDLNLIDSKTGEVLYKAPLKEDVIDEDETSSGKDTIPTFLGYAANGNVTGEYVYVNYGTREDFAKLKDLGVDITGKIAVIRYGYIFRGLKVKFAQDNGAIGVLLYSDPGDDMGITPANGYKQYPKGPARQESSVQRGSSAFLGGIGSYPGDPTTPGYGSKPGCERIDPSGAIPSIPALPISYREVKPILEALNGHGVKLTDEKWIGELEGFDYYTGPSKKHELNLYSDQDFNISTMTNVYGKFEGEKSDEIIVIGNHYDAWIKGGAGDPNSGSAVLLEIARALGELKKAGYKFKRTIYLASWDGEEYSLLGSTEFGETNGKFLKKSVVAYLNLDVAATGSELDFSGPKSLFAVFKKVISKLPYPEEGVGSLLDHYLSTVGDKIGVLGSGSDYTVFFEHLGIPSIDTGFHGNKTAAIYHYHSNYDSYHWMEKFGDKGFVYHGLMAKYLGLLALELSDPELLQFNFGDYADDLTRFLDIVKSKIPNKWLTKSIEDGETWKQFLYTPIEEAEFIKESSNGWYSDSVFPFPEFMKGCPGHRGHYMYDLKAHSNYTLFDILNTTTQDLINLKQSAVIFDEQTKTLQVKWDNRDSLWFWQRIKLHYEIVKQNKLIQFFERNFLLKKGLHHREWFKHIVFASGRYTGYAGQVFPLSQEAIEDGDFDRLVGSLGIVSRTFRRLSHQLTI